MKLSKADQAIFDRLYAERQHAITKYIPDETSYPVAYSRAWRDTLTCLRQMPITGMVGNGEEREPWYGNLSSTNAFERLQNLSASDRGAITAFVCDVLSEDAQKQAERRDVDALIMIRAGLREMFAKLKPAASDVPVELSRPILSAWPSCFDAGRFTNLNWFCKIAERCVHRFGLEKGVANALREVIKTYEKDRSSGWSKVKLRLEHLLSPGTLNLPIDVNEGWAYALAQSMQVKANRLEWSALLKHCLTATSSQPNAKWLKKAKELANSKTGFADAFAAAAEASKDPYRSRRHNYLSAQGLPDLFVSDAGQTILRGLSWTTATLSSQSLPRSLAVFCIEMLRVIPSHGPRSMKVANACLWALGQIRTPDALAEMAKLKIKIRQKPVLKALDKALQSAAAAAGMTASELEELSVPTFGLDRDGKRVATLGEFTATVQLDNDGASLFFSKSDRPLKSVPAALKQEFAGDLKELRAAVKEIDSMFIAQRARIDSLFIENRSWHYSDWHQRYIENSIVAAIATRLVWICDSVQCVHRDGTLQDVTGRQIKPSDDGTIQLWHPVSGTLDEIVAWRNRLAELQITQPFKQAHREIYLLTVAEEHTNTYSNRFASHILKQTQFRALCQARGWTARFIGAFDGGDAASATKKLPGGWRAELWYGEAGQEMADNGGWLYVATDQVRFYREGSNEPERLGDVPRLIFSEAMRDVDLFVGVASVGNDPNWSDGGPQGRYRTYWRDFSFGDLTESAKTRKAVLETLLPRLTKIRDRCRLEDKFLIVRGELRTYKIHLGSGNILMEPNDQYLCIVPDRKPAPGAEKLFLPFEGDSTLAIVLSKAFMLADDTSIKDPSITRQIRL